MQPATQLTARGCPVPARAGCADSRDVNQTVPTLRELLAHGGRQACSLQGNPGGIQWSEGSAFGKFHRGGGIEVNLEGADISEASTMVHVCAYSGQPGWHLPLTASSLLGLVGPVMRPLTSP